MSGSDLPYEFVQKVIEKGNDVPRNCYYPKARVLFTSLLQKHRSCRRWHYGVKLPEDNPNSLAYLFGLSNLELYTLLYLLDIVGFEYFTTTGKFILEIKKIKS